MIIFLHFRVSSRCRLYSGPAIIPGNVANKVVSHLRSFCTFSFSDRQFKLLESSLPNFSIFLYEDNSQEQHTSELYSLAFSYQGTMFATGGADKCIKLWRSSNCKSYFLSDEMYLHALPLLSSVLTNNLRSLDGFNCLSFFYRLKPN